jgi:putative transposase
MLGLPMSELHPDRQWWTAPQIAEAGLPDMPATRQGVEQLIKRDQWRAKGVELARRRVGKGGGWEYNWRLLPDLAKRCCNRCCLPPPLLCG